ncbi:hypothetical protein D3C72_1197540 [compost metagenome]
MRNHHRRHLIVHHLLRLFVQRHAFLVIGYRFRLVDDLIKRLIAPFRRVRAAVGGRTGKQRAEEVIRVARRRGPAHQRRLVLTALHTLKVFAPLIGDDFGLHADFRPVSLNHFGHPPGVRVIRALHRHRPQLDTHAVGKSRLFQQRFGLIGAVIVILQLAVGAPDARRQQVFRCGSRAMEHRVNDRRFVDRHRQRLTHFHVIQRRLLGVKRQESGVQPRFAHQVDIAVGLHARQIGRIWERHHLAFVFLDFSKTHGGVRCDAEHQSVEF